MRAHDEILRCAQDERQVGLRMTDRSQDDVVVLHNQESKCRVSISGLNGQRREGLWNRRTQEKNLSFAFSCRESTGWFGGAPNVRQVDAPRYFAKNQKLRATWSVLKNKLSVSKQNAQFLGDFCKTNGQVISFHSLGGIPPNPRTSVRRRYYESPTVLPLTTEDKSFTALPFAVVRRAKACQLSVYFRCAVTNRNRRFRIESSKIHQQRFKLSVVIVERK